MLIPSHLHSRLIGYQGTTISGIRDAFGVTIDVPPAGSGKEEVIVRGVSLSSIEEAAEKLLAIAKEQSFPKVT